MIENKGQCTALRHFVCPRVSAKELDTCYAKATVVDSSLQSIEQGEFAGILKPAADWKAKCSGLPAGYDALPSCPLMSVKISPELPVKITEQWRQLYVYL